MLLKEFSLHIERHFSFINGKKLLVAVSGGLDSMVLCHLLHSLGYSPHIAHCNFQLRGEESDGDASFVVQFAKDLGLVYHEKTFDTASIASIQKDSIQVAARKLRYTWFKELESTLAYDFLMTAHHAEDSMETFFINFIRGTGLDGLTGIPEINETILRPLLPFSKSDLQAYAHQNKLTWREDSSNKCDKYLRNRIRKEIIPSLKQMNPGMVNSFHQTISYLKDSRAIIDNALAQLEDKICVEQNGETKISIEGLMATQHPRIYLFELLKKYGFKAWEDIEDLLTAQSGKVIYSHSHQLLKDRENLIITKLKANSFIKHVIPAMGTYSFEGLRLKIAKLDPKLRTNENGIAFIDEMEVEFPLCLRKWEKGDYFYPLGMEGKKKLSDYFIDKKRSKNEKESTWILCDKNKIIWIVNDRLDHRVRITPKTKSALKIEFSLIV